MLGWLGLTGTPFFASCDKEQENREEMEENDWTIVSTKKEGTSTVVPSEGTSTCTGCGKEGGSSLACSCPDDLEEWLLLEQTEMKVTSGQKILQVSSHPFTATVVRLALPTPDDHHVDGREEKGVQGKIEVEEEREEQEVVVPVPAQAHVDEALFRLVAFEHYRTRARSVSPQRLRHQQMLSRQVLRRPAPSPSLRRALVQPRRR
mmetsp:Transcript_12230/g.38761  ORF Transcript_12230/g.38761 Transcript_12230/m.38761 type:complete len:205 (-) Transcript_12230:89-703(-)